MLMPFIPSQTLFINMLLQILISFSDPCELHLVGGTQGSLQALENIDQLLSTLFYMSNGRYLGARSWGAGQIAQM